MANYGNYQSALAVAYEDLQAFAESLQDSCSSYPECTVAGDKLLLWGGMVTIKPHEDYPDILTFEGWAWADTVMTGRAPLHQYSHLKQFIKAVNDINEKETMS